MKNIHLYYHGGSKNHGCEAIIRSTLKLFGNQKLEVFSMYPDEDILYELDKICSLRYDKETPIKKGTIRYYLSALEQKLFHSTKINTYFRWKIFFDSIIPGDIYLSTGGDNYCYDGTYKLADYNSLIHKKGGKTVLWGCSIEPDRLTPSVIKDLKSYDLITVRETLTMEGLKKVGIHSNVKLCSDPAFQLDYEKLPLPKNFIHGKTVGINISPLIINSADDKQIVLKCYKKLIEYIISDTDYNIALIPHVIKGGTNDKLPIDFLYNLYYKTERISVIEDCNCEQLKGYISRCSMFIGARTHSTIAAYSSCIPTLVVGYSIKAKGIAKDIFGTYENYVVPVQTLKNENQLKDSFIWLDTNKEYITQYLQMTIPNYMNRANKAINYVEDLY